MENKKNCPYCGEEIMADAKKCRHCGEWLNEAKEPSPTTKKKPNKIIILVASGMALAIAIVAIIGMAGRHNDNPKVDRFTDIISQDSIKYSNTIDSIQQIITRDSLSMWNVNSNVDLNDWEFKRQLVLHSKYVKSQLPVIRHLSGIYNGLSNPTQEQINNYRQLSQILYALEQSRQKFVASVIAGQNMEVYAFEYRHTLGYYETYKDQLDPNGKYHKVMTTKDINKAIYDDLNLNFGSIIIFSNKIEEFVNVQNKILNY